MGINVSIKQKDYKDIDIKDAKFGDKFLCKCGKVAVFFKYNVDDMPILIIEDLQQFVKYSINGKCIYCDDSFISDNNDPDKYDIVSKYNSIDNLDNEILEKLAYDSADDSLKDYWYAPYSGADLFEKGFITGYKKAKE